MREFDKIKRLWFEDGKICVTTVGGKTNCQPLELYPTLFYATPEEREDFYIWSDSTSIRWEKIDEDIHITNLFEEEHVNYDNDVNRLLSRFPWLDMKAFAEYLGMHWTKLARYRFGVWTPSEEMLNRIKGGIVAIGKEMSTAVV